MSSLTMYASLTVICGNKSALLNNICGNKSAILTKFAETVLQFGLETKRKEGEQNTFCSPSFGLLNPRRLMSLVNAVRRTILSVW